MRYKITYVLPEEYKKADADPQYAPKETVWGYIDARYEAEAVRKADAMVEAGTLPAGSMVIC